MSFRKQQISSVSGIRIFLFFLIFFVSDLKTFSQLILTDKNVYQINESHYELDWKGFKNEIPSTGSELVSYYQLHILDRSGSDQNYVLEFIDFRIDDIEIYLPEIDDPGHYMHYRTGDVFPFQSRAVAHKNFVFPLPPVKGKVYTVYFKTRKHYPQGFVVRANIRSYQNFAEYSIQEYALLAFFYGILFCMGVYNLVRFVFTREKLHLLYVFYVTGLSVFSLSRIDGLGFQYLWTSFPELNRFSFPLSLACFVLMSVVFALTFLNIKREYPGLYKIFISLILLRILLLGMTLAGFFHTDLKLFDLFLLGGLILVGVKNALWRSSVRFFFIGYISMYMGFLIYSLQDFDLIPHSILIYYSLNIGVFIETIFLSVAISEKTKLIMLDRQNAQEIAIGRLEENKKLQKNLISELKEKELLKEKVNRELEEKVRERTEELSRKNVELAMQKEKMEKMASQLDKQNYEMHKETKRVKVKNLWPANLSFEEFTELFPSELSCLMYVAEKKWGDKKYVCIKCQHDKFIESKSNLSRKCTRCAHIESVLANTLFHGLRFSLQKALYILHCYTKSRQDLNVSELSRRIDLRVNTCRKFIQKITSQKKGEGIVEDLF